MIKLTNILKEIDDSADRQKYKKMAYSWQKPNGKFIPIKKSHGTDAWKAGGSMPNTDYVDKFWKMGYNRIWYNVHTLFCHNEHMIPNDKQKSALIDLAINLDLQEVEYDGGEEAKILWSVHGVLENSN
jgi:hypothetical protein